MQDVIIRTEGKAGRITLNRPEALNALNQQLMDELATALKKADEDAQVASA